MLLRPRRSFIIDSRLTLTAASFPQQTIRLPIPRVSPYALEEIYVTVQVTIGNAITTGMLGTGLMNIIKRIQLGNIPNSDGKPSNVVDVSGQGLLQFVQNEGLRLDDATIGALYAVNRVQVPATGIYRITYRIPMVHPGLTDGLRPRCLLPIFAYNQDPVLQLDFSAATEISGVADPFSAASVDVFLVTREMQPAAIAQINATGGFINWDLLESPNSPSAGQTNILNKFIIPTPGSYTGLLMYMLKGGATLTPGDLSGTTTAGQETEWQLKGAGKDIIDSWRMKYLRVINDSSRASGGAVFPNSDGTAWNTLALATDAHALLSNIAPAAQTFGGPLSVGWTIQEPSSVFLDFASDGNNDIRELGSLFNTKMYADKGLEVAIYGQITTSGTTTKPNSLNIVGRRLFGDLSTFQTLSGL
jgi:hypothetical protein